MKELQRSFRLRVLLCLVDTEDAVVPLAEVARAAIGYEFTLLCAWSSAECARYLETLKRCTRLVGRRLQEIIQQLLVDETKAKDGSGGAGSAPPSRCLRQQPGELRLRLRAN
jgi:hypothetical protein